MGPEWGPGWGMRNLQVILLRSLGYTHGPGGGSGARSCTGLSLWKHQRPLKIPPAWGEKKLWSHKTGLGKPSDKGHLSASLPMLTGQKEGWASGLPASSVGREQARAAGPGTLPSSTASPGPAGGCCMSCPASAADAPVGRSLGAPCCLARELQAGLLLRSLRACVPLGSPGHSPFSCPNTSQTRGFRSKSHRSSRTQAPLRCASCVSPLPDPFHWPGAWSPLASPGCTHCFSVGAVAHCPSLSPGALPPLEPAPSPSSVLHPPSQQVTLPSA